MEIQIKIYNTLTKRKEIFEPLNDKEVKIYVCGPTVYSSSHIGHARTFIVFDILVRFLEYLGYKVKYVRNITDIGHLSGELLEGEDKVVSQAKKEKVSPWEIVDKYMFEFFEAMDLLNVKRPNVQPRPSQLIPEMQEMIDKLLEKGYAYITETGIYFDVSKFENYGKLSGIKKEELIKHRIEPDPTKRNPADFALWKFCSEDYPLKWKYKGKYGFPGWHIECSVMNLKHLGETIDIHGGGKDLIFPHHENEIAQSESYTGKQFVRYWMHCGFVTVSGEKMAKSKGNFITIKEAIEKVKNPEAIRVWVLMSHYRSDCDYNEKSLNEAKEILDKFYRALDVLEKEEEKIENKELLEKAEKIKNEILNALADDLNFPAALSKYIELATLILSNEGKIGKEKEKIKEIYLDIGSKIFGLFKYYKKDKTIDEKLIEKIIEIRDEIRKKGLYEISDKIRKIFSEFGIEIYDTPKGTKWRIKT